MINAEEKKGTSDVRSRNLEIEGKEGNGPKGRKEKISDIPTMVHQRR